MERIDDISELKVEEVYTRNYNFRRNKKLREKRIRSVQTNIGWWPCVSREYDNGKGVYYVDGKKSPGRKFLKRASNVKIRRNNFDYKGKVGRGTYHKEYDLWHKWI